MDNLINVVFSLISTQKVISSWLVSQLVLMLIMFQPYLLSSKVRCQNLELLKFQTNLTQFLLVSTQVKLLKMNKTKRAMIIKKIPKKFRKIIKKTLKVPITDSLHIRVLISAELRKLSLLVNMISPILEP